MSLRERILGPKSKYDASLPYTYEARVRMFVECDECKSWFSDTICGLIEHLHRHGVKPGEASLLEVYQDREAAIDAELFATPDGEWLFKPAICRAFEEHYKGHIHDADCSFSDRGRGTVGP